MPELTIYYRGTPLLKERITSALTVGSDEDSDICLLDSIFPHHAKIEMTPKSVVIIEVEGKVFANGAPIVGSRVIEDGDIFDIGAYRFQFLESSLPLSELRKRQKTATASIQGESGPHLNLIPTIRFVAPVKAHFRRARFVIGRSPGCDLVLDSPYVSSQHAEIFTKDGNSILRDLHSRNGTYINDLKITEKLLPPAGTIRFGRYGLTYQIEFPTTAPEIEGYPLPGLKSDSSGKMIVGKSPVLKSLINTLKKFAPTDHSVLLLGETGAGKDLLAHFIHAENEKRRNGPFVIVNCAALPPSLADSQLFGHIRGAFTGAVGSHAGFFQQAHKGTLFLDEVGELPKETQAKLLRVIEDGIVRPVGSEKEISVDVRLVAATNRDLDDARTKGIFRHDLYERFDHVIRVPPLRERGEDIPLLVRYFISKIAPLPLETEPGLLIFLQTLPWPGNIRELQRAVRRAVTNALARESRILSEADFEFASSASPSGSDSLLQPISKAREVKRASLKEWLKKYNGNITHVASALGLSRVTIHKWIKEDGIDLTSFKQD